MSRVKVFVNDFILETNVSNFVWSYTPLRFIVYDEYDEPNDMDYWELIDNIESHLTYEQYLKEYYYLTLGVKI